MRINENDHVSRVNENDRVALRWNTAIMGTVKAIKNDGGYAALATVEWDRPIPDPDEYNYAIDDKYVKDADKVSVSDVSPDYLVLPTEAKVYEEITSILQQAIEKAKELPCLTLYSDINTEGPLDEIVDDLIRSVESGLSWTASSIGC